MGIPVFVVFHPEITSNSSPDSILHISKNNVIQIFILFIHFRDTCMIVDNSGFIIFHPEITSNLSTDSILHISEKVSNNN